MPEDRRLVSILFADLVGFTALGSQTDPEVLREQMARYFERMKAVAELHGGTVEKFIGDAVMVAFGVPRAHDDDAERSVRCGLAMQESMAVLNLELRTDFSLRVGINSGETAVKSGDDGHFIVGDPVNVAARLQQGAEPGEVLVGYLTEHLTRRAIVYQPHGRLPVKGKVEPILAFRAVRPRSAIPRQSRGVGDLRAPLVGRERELRLLLDVFGRVAEDRQTHLFTMVGNAGIGKSRLVEEALARMATEFSPRILQGRCLPYGEGITYWPVIEILREDAGITMEDDRETAIRKLDNRLASIGQVSEDQSVLARRLIVVLGLEPADTAIPEVPASEVATELAWSLRRYIEAVASQNAVVLVIDDLQWAEPAIVELISQVTRRARLAPVFWICMARPEFLEQHPKWGAGLVNASLITLNPLTRPETSTLLSGLLDIEDIPSVLQGSILERSEGNPLFCEEFLRMLIEESRIVRVGDRWQAATGAVEVRVPETIQALLIARLDTLPEAERRVLEAASIVGERFLPEQIRAICIDIDVDSALDELLAKGLVVEDTTGGDVVGLRLKHLLLRDVVYGGLAKRSRADLHDRFAIYLESATSDRGAEYAEIIAYHAALAFSLTREMRLSGNVLSRRARGALRWDLFLGERAFARGDRRLLADFISNARSALEADPGDRFDTDRVRLRLLEVEQFGAAGRYDEAAATAAEVVREAEGLERRDLAAAAHLAAAKIELERNPSSVLFQHHAAEAGQLFRLTGDRAGELEAEWLTVLWRLGSGEGQAALHAAIRLAERAVELNDKSRAAARFATTATFAAQAGLPQKASECVQRASTLASEAGARLGRRLVLAQAMLDTLMGDPKRAVDRLRQAVVAADEDGSSTLSLKRLLAIELIRLRRYPEAEAILEDALRRSQDSGELWNRSELFARSAVTAVAQGKLDTAEDYAQQALQAVTPGDRGGVVESNWALGELRAAQGRDREAETAYRQAFAEIARGPYWVMVQDAELSFARFLVERGRGSEALPMLNRMQAWLDAAGYAIGREQIAQLRARIIDSAR